MLVLCLSKCPPALRGDLTRWLQEISLGVYAGHVSARVREELWERVVANCRDGQATMVYSARNEQRMAFRVHNSAWIPIDFDGMALMLRPSSDGLPGRESTPHKAGGSTAAAIQKAKRYGAHRQGQRDLPDRYAVVDLETTGLSAVSDRIIEIGAVRVENGEVVNRFERLIRQEGPLPEPIRGLTGITDSMLLAQGADEADALRAFSTFIRELPLIMHNAGFDLNFLRQACLRRGLPVPVNEITDTLTLAKRTLDDVDDFKLRTIAAHFSIDASETHRSLDDCLITK